MIGDVAVIRLRVWRQTIMAGASGLLLGGLLGCALIVWTGQHATVIVHEARQLNETIRRGGHLDLYIDLDRVRDCPAETSRWLWNWVEINGQSVRQFYPLASTTVAANEFGANQHYIVSVPIPPAVWPGEWFYWSRTTEHCSWIQGLLHNPVWQTNNLPIHIVE